MNLHAAQPAVPPAAAMHRDASALLQSIVEVARAIFGAQASSVCLLDEEAGELVFEAISGQGEGRLIGHRFPAHRGIAGYVALTGEPLVVEDLADNGMFARDIAESTQFVPGALMAAPLLYGERVLGVLEVLDPVPQCRGNLADLDLLTLFAHQAAVALHVVLDERARQQAGLARTLQTVDAMSEGSRAASLELIDAVRAMLLPRV